MVLERLNIHLIEVEFSREKRQIITFDAERQDDKVE